MNSSQTESGLNVDDLVGKIVKHGHDSEVVRGGIAMLRDASVITPELLNRFEAHLFDGGIDELDIPVTHTFTKNSYIREGTLPAGSLILGHAHREHHYCVILTGRMTILNPDKTTTEVVAPCCFLAAPGRKLAVIKEDLLMQNIHPTANWGKHLSSDIEAMEEFLYHRSDAWKRHRAKKLTAK